MVGAGVEPDVAVAKIPVDTGVSACVKTQTDFSLQEYPKGQQVSEPELSRPQTGSDPSRFIE